MPGLLDMPAGQYLMFQQAGKQYGLDPLTLQAIAATETGGTFNPNLTSRAGAQGLMQLMPSVARALGVDNAYDPTQAIPAAAGAFSQLLGNQERKVGAGWPALSRALMSYNNGPNPARWNNAQTQSYPPAFLNYYRQLQQLMPQPAAPQPPQPAPPMDAQQPNASGGLLAMLPQDDGAFG